MAHLRTQFEKELKNRLALKKQANISDEMVLLRTFKYYDLDNVGTVTREQFAKVVDKLGFQIYDIQDIYSLYNLYAGGSILNYRQLTQTLYQGTTGLTRQFSPSKFSGSVMSTTEPHDRLVKLQRVIQEAEPGTLFNLCDHFGGLRGQINLVNFQSILAQFAPQLQESRQLFLYLDIKKQGSISTKEFIDALRGPISYQIQEKLSSIFYTMSNGQKFIDVDAVLGIKNHNSNATDQYYDAVTRLTNKQDHQLTDTFSKNVRVYFQLTNDVDRRFSAQTFTEFNFMFYFDVTDETAFQKLMDEIWGVQSGLYTTVNHSQLYNPLSSQKKSNPHSNVQTPVRRLDYVNEVSSQQFSTCNSIRLLLSKRGPRAFINMHKQLRIKDEDCDDQVTFAEMKKAFSDYHVDVGEEDLRSLFNHLDANATGRIPIRGILESLQGLLNAEQSDLVNEVFTLLDTDLDNVVQLRDLKAAYSAKFHPDVRRGRKSESEVLAEFLDSYEAHHVLHSSLRDTKVSRREFHTYYEVLAACHDEPDFTNILRGTFKGVLDQYVQQSSVPPVKGFVVQNAPFGTSEAVTDYTTFLRPGTAAVQNSGGSSAKKSNHAGIPSWPGYCLTFESGVKQVDEFKEVQLQLQQKLKQRGLRGTLQLLKALLRQISPDAKIYNSTQRQMSQQQLNQAFQEVRLNLDNKQIFELMGRSIQNVDIIQTEESTTFGQITQNMLGQMSEHRRNVVHQTFSHISTTKQIKLESVKNLFNPHQHPDLIKGARNEDEVLVSFLDTYDTHYYLYFDAPNSLVTLSQFEHYYCCISCINDDDRYFEALMRSSFNK